MSWGDEKYHRVATAILLSSDYKVIELLTYVDTFLTKVEKAFDTRQKGFRLRPKNTRSYNTGLNFFVY